MHRDDEGDEHAGERPDEAVDTDAAWAAIVANYGERAVLEPDEPPAAEQPEPRRQPAYEELDDSADLEDLEDPDERYHPPPPPPVPIAPPDRLLAWLGVFGAPTLLLVFLIAGVMIPTWLGWLLVAAFIGGFGYLVARMPRGRDPWDDGAQL